MNTIQLLQKDKRSRMGISRFEKKKVGVWFLCTIFRRTSELDCEPVYHSLHKYFVHGRRRRPLQGLPQVTLICKLTGRPRAVIRTHGLARTPFKNLTHLGRLSGVVRSSW